MKLDIETRQLQRSWKEFLESTSLRDLQRQSRQPDDVVNEIKDSIQHWSSHSQQVLFRKSIKRAQKCLDTMESHMVLMQTLADSKYCDLFFGVVYSIVKAVREQYRVAEAFLKFLARTNDAVASAAKADCSTDMVAALYGQIFLFLGHFLGEYVSKARCRLLYSHNEDFNSIFKYLMTSVENLVVLRREFDGSCSNHTNFENNTNNDNAHLQKVGLEGAARKEASQTTTVRRLIWNIKQQKILNGKLAAEQARILEAFLASLRAQVDQIHIDGEQFYCEGNITVHTQTRAPVLLESTPKRRLLKTTLQHDSSLLQDFFDNSEQIYPYGIDRRLEISTPIAATLFNWTQTNPSLPLAIQASPPCLHEGTPIPPTSLLSACYVSVARNQDIPVVSHFCALPPKSRSKMNGLIALVYSLIRQLIDLVPPMLDCDSNCDLSGERFRLLNGSIGSWTDALSILDTLLHYRPPLLFCVIDSLDVLEGDANDNHREDQTEQYIRAFVNLLASHTQNTNAVTMPTSATTAQQSTYFSFPPGPLKVLFTTVGECRAIRSTLVSQGLGQVMITKTEPTASGFTTDSIDDIIMTDG